jgi:hypothetical protein
MGCGMGGGEILCPTYPPPPTPPPPLHSSVYNQGQMCCLDKIAILTYPKVHLRRGGGGGVGAFVILT